MSWHLLQDFENYRDYENTAFGEQFARVTFARETHTAYANLSNSEATAENYVPSFLDKTVPLSWEEAESIVGEKVS